MNNKEIVFQYKDADPLKTIIKIRAKLASL